MLSSDPSSEIDPVVRIDDVKFAILSSAAAIHETVPPIDTGPLFSLSMVDCSINLSFTWALAIIYIRDYNAGLSTSISMIVTCRALKNPRLRTKRCDLVDNQNITSLVMPLNCDAATTRNRLETLSGSMQKTRNVQLYSRLPPCPIESRWSIKVRLGGVFNQRLYKILPSWR